MILCRTLAATVLIALAAPALAADTVVPDVANQTRFDMFRQHVTGLLDTDPKITAEGKKATLGALDRIQSRYARVANPAQMSEQDRMDTYNDQEIINTITTHAAPDSRMLCERIIPTGSHRIKVFCMTVALRAERRRTAQQAMTQSANNTFSGATIMRHPGR